MKAPSVLDMSLKDAYSSFLKRTFARTGRAGPLDLYDPRNSPFVIQYLCKRSCTVDWDRQGQKWDTKDSPLIAWDIAKDMEPATRRRLPVRHVNSELGNRGLPPTGKISFGIAVPPHVPHVKALVRDALAPVRRLNPLRRRFLYSKIRFTRKRADILRWARSGIGGAKELDLSVVDKICVGERDFYGQRLDLEKWPGSTNIQIIKTTGQVGEEYDKQLRTTLWRLRLSCKERALAHSHTKQNQLPPFLLLTPGWKSATTPLLALPCTHRMIT